jgi:hypothetical protein
MHLVVTCGRPGMYRGGQPNPAAAVYPLDHFSEAQLLDLFGDPHISVVVGHPLSLATTPEHAPHRPPAATVHARLQELLAQLQPGPQHFDATAGTVVTDQAVVDADARTGKTVEHANAADTPIGAVIDPQAAAQAAEVKEEIAGDIPAETARAVRARGRA